MYVIILTEFKSFLFELINLLLEIAFSFIPSFIISHHKIILYLLI